MAVIDEIKKSKDKLALYQTVVPRCYLSQVKEGQNYSKQVICRLVDNEIRAIASKTENTLNIIKHQTLNCSPRSSRSEALLKSLKASRTQQ